jgi:hypothetical protein
MKLSVLQMPGLSASDLPTLNNILSKITHAINNVDFGAISAHEASASENIWCTMLAVTAVSGNVPYSAAHHLSRKPQGTIVIWQDQAANLYKPTDATSADTSTQVFYTFSASGTSAATSAISAVLLLI